MPGEYERTAVDAYTDRGASLIPITVRETPIVIVGVGGLGSWAAMGLARVGAQRLTLVDPDTVSEANIGPQLYTPDMIGGYKVHALAEQLEALGTEAIVARILLRITSAVGLPEQPCGRSVVLSLPDSMSARSDVYESARERGYRWLLDGRMGRRDYRVYVCDLSDETDRTRYERTLYTDSQAAELPCTERATAYVGLACGGLLTALACACLESELGRVRPPSMVAWDGSAWGTFLGKGHAP